MIAVARTDAAVPVDATSPAKRHSAFHLFLSELNPLQYLPVIGTIYRAVTGDSVPETARTVGSLVVSGLTGGPIGVAVNLATLAAERITGVDPERIGQHLLGDIGSFAHHSKPTVTVTTMPARQADASPPQANGWSAAQLAAYGVTTSRDGTLKRGGLEGSDVLNDLELARSIAPSLAAPRPGGA